ncbi:hypothetical protein [Dyella amyloliquefaciens]|uniref:hypothetical protein n=1 Tax=Dyella amyloliquefaciens TaxID=1770545 RepID=UPI00102ECD5F|nr:hypothetical protein [Dyella amyloliquefaciens]
MAMLVGIYLLQVESVEVPRDGASSWTATWTLLRSPSGNHLDWELLVQRDTPRTFPREADALRAGQDEGTTFARMLQGDDGLEPMIAEELQVKAPLRETVAPARRSFALH